LRCRARAGRPRKRITIVGLVEGSNQTAEATVYDGSADNVSTRVSRREVDPYEYAQPGTFVVAGTVEGTSLQAWATVTVKEEM
jgi:hypothetical protein